MDDFFYISGLLAAMAATMSYMDQFYCGSNFLKIRVTFCGLINSERKRGQWAVYYTSPQNFHSNVFLFVGLTTLGTEF